MRVDKRFEGYQKGVNLGGWLSQASLDSKHLEEYIKEEDFIELAGWDIDHVRLPIDYELICGEEGDWKEEGFVYIDRCVAWCEKYHLNLVIDLHKTKGYTFDQPDTAYSFFEEKELIAYFMTLWETLAARYAHYGKMIAFELLNEIVPYEVANRWNPIWQEACERIRKYATENPIIVGGVCYNSVSTISLLEKPLTTDVIFTFHFYEPFFFTHQGATWVEIMPKEYRVDYPGDFENHREHFSENNQQIFAQRQVIGFGEAYFEALLGEAVDQVNAFQIPLYCGEYGCIDNAEQEDVMRWFDDIHATFTNTQIGRAVWNYKSLSFGVLERKKIAGYFRKS